MNRPLTDRERCVMLEARVAELEEELAAWHASVAEDAEAERTQVEVDSLRRVLKRAWPLSGGLQPALILLALLERPGVALPRGRLFDIMRTPRSILTEENNRCLVAVRLCHLRRALDNLGFPGVIQHLRDAGWSISPQNCTKITQALIKVHPQPRSGRPA